jgi:hypothetical protein
MELNKTLLMTLCASQGPGHQTQFMDWGSVQDLWCIPKMLIDSHRLPSTMIPSTWDILHSYLLPCDILWMAWQYNDHMELLKRKGWWLHCFKNLRKCITLNLRGY